MPRVSMHHPTCVSYFVRVACPRCESVAVRAQVFPSGNAGDVVAEYGCAACGVQDWPPSAYAQIQEAAWDMQPPAPSTTPPDWHGNPYFSDQQQIDFLVWLLRHDGALETDRQVAVMAEAWWMGDWPGHRCPTLEEAEAFRAARGARVPS